jgi:hypothetical protein
MTPLHHASLRGHAEKSTCTVQHRDGAEAATRDEDGAAGHDPSIARPSMVTLILHSPSSRPQYTAASSSKRFLRQPRTNMGGLHCIRCRTMVTHTSPGSLSTTAQTRQLRTSTGRLPYIGHRSMVMWGSRGINAGGPCGIRRRSRVM